ncbi:MAG: hypothetical protein HC866_20810 [Leptolyngbyaceae cyanobacterium RU_5_1]|nr:hypothetical protein [Leptolyngbyaceae cyanobacterium RU_5_1]
MNSREVGNFLSLTFGLAVLVLFTFGILQWLQIPSGSFLDWLIGAVSFWWLLVIVTVPWNIHFAAKTVQADAAESQTQGITVDAQQLRYVRQVAQRSLWVAIALHILSALGLYLLAVTGISAIGYVTSSAALLLTALRPAVSFYQYLAARLREIGHTFKYPREDVVELRDRVIQVETTLQQLEYQLNLENADSFAATQQRLLTALRQDLTQLAATHEDLKATNHADHERLARDARNAIAQLSTDGQVLEHVREIIRFFKEA